MTKPDASAECNPADELEDVLGEDVTPEQRRRAFDALSAAASSPYIDLDVRLFDALAHEVVEPRGEVFDGETCALVEILIDEQDGHSFASRVLAQAAIEVAQDGGEGTRAARTAMLRSIASFLLHDRVTRMATSSRNDGICSSGAQQEKF